MVNKIAHNFKEVYFFCTELDLNIECILRVLWSGETYFLILAIILWAIK